MLVIKHKIKVTIFDLKTHVFQISAVSDTHCGGAPKIKPSTEFLI